MEDIIRDLLKPRAYSHPVDSVELIETHISWVFVAGEFVYKVKKPVNFGFLDFSTPEKRKFYCDEELRLNRRFAPHIYLDVVVIRRGRHGACFGGGEGSALVYAVRMRRFDERTRFDHLLSRGQLPASDIERLVAQLVSLQPQLATATTKMSFGEPDTVMGPVRENFVQIAPLLTNDEDRARLAQLDAWSEQHFETLRDWLQWRKQQGYVRECHGDLHLQNIAMWEDKPVMFDCIEFNAAFRWIDIMSEMAFLIMDLEDRGARGLASVALNTYLQESGDFSGLRLLRFYLVYRALVRAKVAQLRLQQPGLSDDDCSGILQQYREYVALAESYVRPVQPVLCIMHGLSGSGKTTLAKALLERVDGVLIRSDVERKRLQGMRAEARSGSGIDGGIYTADMTERTYNALAQQAAHAIGGGYCAFVDATFLRRGLRDQFRQFARKLNCPFLIIDCAADESVLRARILQREREGYDASEADLAVLNQQIDTQEPLNDDELNLVLTIDMKDREHMEQGVAEVTDWLDKIIHSKA